MNIFNNFIDIKIKNGMGITGITDEFFCVYLYNLFEKYNKNILVVVDTLNEANNLFSSLSELTDDVLLFPMDDFLTSEALAISPDLEINRLSTLEDSLNSKHIVICNLMGYLRYLPNVSTYKNSFISLKKGDQIDLDGFKDKLYSLGYKRDSVVNNTGEMALRGFIVDLFPLEYDNPVRIEFFGDEIDSIRFFDAETQLSIEDIDDIVIKPCTEFITFKTVDNDKFSKQKYLPLYENVNSIYDYLDDNITVFKNYEQLSISSNDLFKQCEEYKIEKDVEFKNNYMFSFDEINPSFSLYYMNINNIKNNKISDIVDYNVKTINYFYENIDLIHDFLNEYLNKGFTIVIFLKEYQIKSISGKLKVPYCVVEKDKLQNNKVNFINGSFPEGFIYDKFVILTAKELFKESVVKNKYKNRFRYSTNISDLSKLNVGDYVVHESHGIGIYNGIKNLVSNDISKDYIEILYSGSDKIYIPVEKISLLYKYSGKEGTVPKINSLSGSDWIKTKNRVINRVNNMADQLIKLYSERSIRKGFAFSKDNDLLKEFEKSFPYNLTKDQKVAIDQIKEDMEKPIPMDRLLCGDVGFGKTEVAFVAAFKAILDSKQVFILCPTTILSNQHYQNALKRFEGFPVNIGNLNRFTTPREERRIIEGLKDGTMDLVIGTHKLLSQYIKPKNLGLLIIDEEQRFGVKHKEIIKEYKTNVDVLTLTATPIPRTLQMSLTGIRSLSLIETPPINRYPVQTYVIEENDALIKDVINKEIARKGQTFILYNRVDSIDYEYDKLTKLIPNARITIAHGQLPKSILESRIEDFINYKYDVLLCSTIIETGIDIPNVNSLIIFDADRFGLSQLYQIRGRVGRSDKFAYAYLMYKPYKKLTDTAIKRLNVIKEFTELGSGFSIANRDLAIRGAGDILGSEQAGFIDSVGIDLYLKMLNDEVGKRNNTIDLEEDEETDLNLNLLNVSTHISDNMAEEDELKIEIHKLINTIDNKSKFNKIKTELEDRFGKLNEDVIIYMYAKWFDNLCKKMHINTIHETRNFTEIIFSRDILELLDVEEIFVFAVKLSDRFKFMSRGNDMVIVLNTIRIDKHPVYYLVDLLEGIYTKYYNNII